MPGLKKHYPDVRFSSNRVTADEIDQRVYYKVLKPSISDSFLGTVEATEADDFVIDETKTDYPRTVLVSITGVAGGMGGTATVTGTNQFGQSQSETIGFASANGGGTAAGTKIFDTVTAATVDGLDGLDGTAIGTCALGFAIGTASGIEAYFGLPVKIGAVSDVKRIIWNDNGTIKGVNGGTVNSDYVDTSNHSFRHNEVLAAADDIYVEVLSTHDSSNDANVA
jgi:hypothetical protein